MSNLMSEVPSMINTILIDGEIRTETELNPAKHRYLGMFRPSPNPMQNPRGYILCKCGEVLQYRGQEYDHYIRGCCDIPQYVTIK